MSMGRTGGITVFRFEVLLNRLIIIGVMVSIGLVMQCRNVDFCLLDIEHLIKGFQV